MGSNGAKDQAGSSRQEDHKSGARTYVGIHYFAAGTDAEEEDAGVQASEAATAKQWLP